MALYSPGGFRLPQTPRRDKPPLFGSTIKMIVIGWAGFFALGVFMALYDCGELPHGPAWGTLALTSLLCCVMGGLALRFRPDNKALRTLAAALLGFPFGIAALGVVTPHDPWPPAGAKALIFGLVFAFGFAWSVIRPDD
jgi:drug/metabolite transporter (DMT)-like permease